MHTLDKIRMTGAILAKESKITGLPKIDEIPYDSEIVQDLITRLLDDVCEFITFEQFGNHFNLHARTFKYMFGQGAQFAYNRRCGLNVEKINYMFHDALQGKLPEHLPHIVSDQLRSKIKAMMNMYMQMFTHVKGSQEQLMMEGFSFLECISTMLNGAFFYGRELCLSVELTENENAPHTNNIEDDIPYDYDNYNQIYQYDDFNTETGDYVLSSVNVSKK